MNIQQAMFYALASSPDGTPGGIDVRLASFLAALHQHGKLPEEVTFDSWWAARCQLGVLVGLQLPEVGFGAKVPCGKKSTAKVANADEFCDSKRRPAWPDVAAALRRLALMCYGAGLKPYCEEAGQHGWRWPDVDLPAPVLKAALPAGG